jgi:predicted alpha/beta hydrolase family esterase
MQVIHLPGIGNSGEQHWQSLWEREDASIRRFQPRDWDRPQLTDWSLALNQAVEASAGPIVLVAHSLACLLVVHWAASNSSQVSRVAGAMLVAVPDPESVAFPVEAASFGPAPQQPLAFPVLLLASGNDPYASLAYTKRCTRQWQAGMIELGDVGHINGASGLGDWPQGRALLSAFSAGLRR